MQKVPADGRDHHRGDEGGPDDDAHVRVGEALLLPHHGEEGGHQGQGDGAEEQEEAEDGHVEAPPQRFRGEASTPSSGLASVDNRVGVSMNKHKI